MRGVGAIMPAMANTAKYLNPFTDFGFKKLFDREELLAYENSLKHYRDMKNVIDTAKVESKAEGIAEGIEIGRAEGVEIGELKRARETARKALRKNMPLGDIAELTGLTEEEIAALQTETQNRP